MKSRAKELVEKAVGAMVSAIEIYNKPDFKYREEAFAILAINAWELLVKAQWLQRNNNKVRTLYVREKGTKKDGSPYVRPRVKTTASGNPVTHTLDYLAKKLVEEGDLSGAALNNLNALREIRDSSVHFYNNNHQFALQLQEVGSAAAKNFVTASRSWFDVDLSKFNFYLMPLAFLHSDHPTTGLILNREERNVAEYIRGLDAANDPQGQYSVTVNVDVRFSRSRAADALSVQWSRESDALKVQLTEQQFKDRYPLTYRGLTDECRTRYSDFKENSKYHDVRKKLDDDPKYCKVRRLDPDNPKSTGKKWYSRSAFTVLDQHYAKSD